MASKDPNTDSSTSSEGNKHTNRYSRISKENLFMVLALWMQNFPVDEDAQPPEDGAKNDKHTKPHRKVGAVLVLPNDILYAVDCSRDGVHGTARLLIKHHDIPKGCKMFISRKPCSFCAKLLVQSKIERVFFLPFEPEYLGEKEEQEKEDEEKDEFGSEKSRVDLLFKTSTISQSVFVPKVEKGVNEDADRKHPTPPELTTEVDKKQKKLHENCYNEEWMEKAKENLPWPALDDDMKTQVRDDFKDTMLWMARILVRLNKADHFRLSPSSRQIEKFDPVNDILRRKQTLHLVQMAEFLGERSDDPKTGVGAIIANKDMEIKALGWNGFPIKALYGEFPRASKHDKKFKDKKYPYVIHAEQNALLMRNSKNLEGGILFVTKTPCDECVPLIKMAGIKTIVLGENLSKEPPSPKDSVRKNLRYAKCAEEVRAGVFWCFEREAKKQREEKSIPPTTPKRRKMEYETP